jgi:hypothetical protein
MTGGEEAVTEIQIRDMGEIPHESGRMVFNAAHSVDLLNECPQFLTNDLAKRYEAPGENKRFYVSLSLTDVAGKAALLENQEATDRLLAAISGQLGNDLALPRSYLTMLDEPGGKFSPRDIKAPYDKDREKCLKYRDGLITILDKLEERGLTDQHPDTIRNIKGHLKTLDSLKEL